MSKSKPGDVSIATLTVLGADEMTEAGRKALAAWLRSQADAIVKEGDRYAARFRARYMR